MSFQSYGTFNRYTPANPPFSCGYAHNEQGEDFYDLRLTLRDVPGVTWLAIDPNDTVQMASNSILDLFVEAGRRLVSVDQVADPKALVRKVLGSDGSFSDPAPPPVLSVAPAQGMVALSRAGLLDQVKAAVAGQGGELEIWFTRALSWERQNPNVIALGTALGLDADQIDALFATAAQIEA